MTGERVSLLLRSVGRPEVIDEFPQRIGMGKLLWHVWEGVSVMQSRVLTPRRSVDDSVVTLEGRSSNSLITSYGGADVFCNPETW